MMPFRPQKIKGVIFDLDQTIIDSLGALTEAFNTGTGKFGLEPVTGERIAHFLDEGLRLGEMLLELYPSVFEEDGKRQACGDMIRKAYFELEPQKVMLKPGVKPTLESLKERGVKIGIVTGRKSQGERKWLELRRLNIHQSVGIMVTGAEAPAKPAPDGVTKCMKELGLSPEECVFVGDSIVDIMAGKRAGVRTIAVCTGVAGKEPLAELGPDYVLDDLNSLLSYLSKLESKLQKNEEE